MQLPILCNQGCREASREASWPRSRCKDSAPASFSARVEGEHRFLPICAQAHINVTLPFCEFPFGECLKSSEILNQMHCQPRLSALSLSEQTKPCWCPAVLEQHSRLQCCRKPISPWRHSSNSVATPRHMFHNPPREMLLPLALSQRVHPADACSSSSGGS